MLQYVISSSHFETFASSEKCGRAATLNALADREKNGFRSRFLREKYV